MTRFICHGCGPTSPPCRAEVPGVDANTLRCIVESDEAMPADWKLETEREPDEDELFDPMDV